MNRRPTIHDVAAHAGVSKSTVSLVLKSSAAIKADTATRVRRSMEAVGYVYNRAAANLRSSSTGLVGLVINDLRNPFFSEFATSLQMALFARGYATVISNSDEDPDMQDQIVRSMVEYGVTALVISPSYGETSAMFEQIARAGVPTLQVLRQVNPQTDVFPFSSFDYCDGGGQAMRHLIKMGAKRIAFVGGLEGRPVTNERMKGYLDEMRLAGADPVVLYGRPSRLTGANLAEELMQNYPEIDAVLCFNDLVALGLTARLMQSGIVPGRDFRVVGFDDIEESAQCWPAISTVSCKIGKFGETTAAKILDWITNGTKPAAIHREPVELVVRASSAGVTP